MLVSGSRDATAPARPGCALSRLAARYAGRALLLAGATLSALAQQPSAAQADAVRQACRADYQAHCAGVSHRGQAALACLQHNAAALSAACQQALRAAAPAGRRAGRGAPSERAEPRERWPHTIRGEAGSALVYQPQVVSWPDRQTLNTRIALQITPKGGKAVLGSVEVSFATSTDLATRWVGLSQPKLLSSRLSGRRCSAGAAVPATHQRAAGDAGRQAGAAGHGAAQPAPGR